MKTLGNNSFAHHGLGTGGYANAFSAVKQLSPTQIPATGHPNDTATNQLLLAASFARTGDVTASTKIFAPPTVLPATHLLLTAAQSKIRPSHGAHVASGVPQNNTSSARILASDTLGLSKQSFGDFNQDEACELNELEKQISVTIKELEKRKQDASSNPIETRTVTRHLQSLYRDLSAKLLAIWQNLQADSLQPELASARQTRVEHWQKLYSCLPMEFTLDWPVAFQESEFARLANQIKKSANRFQKISQIKLDFEKAAATASQMQREIASQTSFLNFLLSVQKTFENIDPDFLTYIENKIEKAENSLGKGPTAEKTAQIKNKILALQEEKRIFVTEGIEAVKRARTLQDMDARIAIEQANLQRIEAHINSRINTLEKLNAQINASNTTERTSSLQTNIRFEEHNKQEAMRQADDVRQVIAWLGEIKNRLSQEPILPLLSSLISGAEAEISATDLKLNSLLGQTVTRLSQDARQFEFDYTPTSLEDAVSLVLRDFKKQDTAKSLPPDAEIFSFVDDFTKSVSKSSDASEDETTHTATTMEQLKKIAHLINQQGEEINVSANDFTAGSPEFKNKKATASQYFLLAKLTGTAAVQYIQNEFAAIRGLMKAEIENQENTVHDFMITQTERITWLASHFVKQRETDTGAYYQGLAWLGQVYAALVDEEEDLFSGYDESLPSRWLAMHNERLAAKKQLYVYDEEQRKLSGFYHDEMIAFEQAHSTRLPDRLPLFIRPNTEIDNAYRDSGSNPRFFQTGLGTAIMYPNEGELFESDQGLMIAFHGAGTQVSTINSSGSFMRKVVSSYTRPDGEQAGVRGLSVVAVSNPFHEFGPHDLKMENMDHLLDWVDALANYYDALLQTKTGRTLPVILFGRSTGSNTVLEHAHKRGTRPVVGMSGYAPTPYWNYHDFDALEKLGRNFNESAVRWVQKLETQWTYHKRAIPLLTSALILAGLLDPGYPKTLPDRYPPEVTKLLPELTDKNPRDLELTLPEYWQDVHARFGPSVELFMDPKGDHNLFMTINSETGKLDLEVQATAMAKLAAFLDRVFHK